MVAWFAALSLTSAALAQVPPTIRQFEAGPIWDEGDADLKCPAVCKPPSKWTGDWRTTIPNEMSTCDCAIPVRRVQAGPLWSTDDATAKCPGVCAPTGWTGDWRTTVEGQMSECDCVDNPARTGKGSKVRPPRPQ